MNKIQTGSGQMDRAAPAVSEKDDLLDLGALASSIWRGKWIIGLFAAVLVLLAGYYAYFVATEKFRSTAVVMLDTQQSNIVDLDSVVGGISGESSQIKSEVEVLESRTLMAKVVERLDLTTDPEFNGALRSPPLRIQIRRAVLDLVQPNQTPVERSPEEAAQRTLDGTVNGLLRSVRITNLPQTLVFEIRVESENPRKAALIADTIAETYILNQIAVKYEATEQATTWLSERVAELQVQLETSEAEVAEFSTATDLVSPQALAAQEAQLKDVRDRVVEARRGVEAARAQSEALQAAATRQEQAEVAGDLPLTRLLTRAQTDTTAATAFDTRFAQILDRADVSITRAEQQVEALVASQQALEARIDVQAEDLIELQQLTRESEAVRLLYEYFLTRLKETSAQQGIQQADSRILSNAVVPLGPSSPQRSLILVMSAIIGTLLGVGYVLLREARASGFRTASELETHAGYPVLGQIPLIPARGRRKTLSYLSNKPASVAVEAYRNLRTSLMLSNPDNPPEVILSTSCVPAEGKTTNSLALAQNLTGLGKSVLLIEGDIRRSTFNQYFDQMPKGGLASVVTGAVSLEDAIITDDESGMSILTGEAAKANAADLFASSAFEALVTEVRAKFDVVIIDSPPVLVVPDARIIAELVDAILFTVHWDKTSRYQVDEALRLFHAGGQKITGFVLSQINTSRLKAYGYGSKYGAYGAYGSKYYTN